jgi:hypothetical protein
VLYMGSSDISRSDSGSLSAGSRLETCALASGSQKSWGRDGRLRGQALETIKAVPIMVTASLLIVLVTGALIIWFLLSNILASLLWTIVLPFNICLWILRALLSLFPGVSGLLDFLFTTATYSVFSAHAVLIWDNLIICAAMTVAAAYVSLFRKHLLKIYIFVYIGTFLYITISTLLPMFLLAVAVGLVATAVCHFFPRARPKHTGPLMCFAASLIMHFFFIESPKVSKTFFYNRRFLLLLLYCIVILLISMRG